MRKKLSTEDFIERAKKIHRDIYDYSVTEYRSAKEKISYICPIHGMCEQTAKDHLRGRGCKKCGSLSSKKNQSLTKAEFINRAKKKYGSKFDYSLTEYKNMKSKIKIICSTHGIFEQYPGDFLNGHNCKFCSRENLSEERKGNKTIYEKAKKTNIKKYGVQNYRQAHLKNIQLLTKEYLEENFLDKNGCIKLQEMMQFYNIKETACYRYIRNFSIRIKYKGGGFNPNKPAILYYLYDPQEDLYKIGITNNTIEERFGKTFCSNRAIAIKEQKTFDKGIDAYSAEQEILEQFAYARCINNSWPEEKGGRTEFFNEDILHKDD